MVADCVNNQLGLDNLHFIDREAEHCSNSVHPLNNLGISLYINTGQSCDQIHCKVNKKKPNNQKKPDNSITNIFIHGEKSSFFSFYFRC